MQSFREPKVWEKSHALALEVYRVSSGFPKHEQFGLTNQIRRSAYSVPTNIAEGCGRFGNAELGRFLQIAMGSASELEYQLLLAHDLGYIEGDTYRRLEMDVTEVKRMLTSLHDKVKSTR